MAIQKVFGWLGRRRACKTHTHQTREIAAAASKAAVARLAGYANSRSMFNLAETGNAAEVAIATRTPGVVFWKPLDAPPAEYSQDAISGNR